MMKQKRTERLVIDVTPKQANYFHKHLQKEHPTTKGHIKIIKKR